MNKPVDNAKAIPDEMERTSIVGQLRRIAQQVKCEIVERENVLKLLGEDDLSLGPLKRWHAALAGEPKATAIVNDLHEVIGELWALLDETRSCNQPPVIFHWMARERAEYFEDFGWRLEVLAERIGASLSAADATAPETTADKRNAWLYGECCKGIPYFEIRQRLKKKPKNWERIESDQGIKKAAERYAERFGLPMPASRKPGRPRKRKTKHR